MARRRSKFSGRGSKKKMISLFLIVVAVIVFAILVSNGTINLKNKADVVIGGCTYSQPVVHPLVGAGNLPYVAPNQTIHIPVRILSGITGTGCPTHRFRVTWSSPVSSGITATISPQEIDVPAYIPETTNVYQGEGYGARLIDVSLSSSSYGAYGMPSFTVTDLDQTDPTLATRQSGPSITLYVGGGSDIYTLNLATGKPSYALGNKVAVTQSVTHLGASYTIPTKNSYGTALQTFATYWVRRPDGTFFDIPPSTIRNNLYRANFSIGKKDPKGTWQIYSTICCNAFSNILSQDYGWDRETFEVK